MGTRTGPGIAVSMPGVRLGASEFRDRFFCRFHSGGDRVGTEASFFDAHEMKVVDADKTEESRQQAFMVFRHLIVGIFAATRRCDHDLAPARQAFRSGFRILERDAWHAEAIEP